MRIAQVIVGLVIGAVFGFGALFALTPAFAAFHTPGAPAPAWMPLIVIGLGASLGATAPTVRRVFGRGFLYLGASVFVLPLSAFLLSGRVFNDVAGGAASDSGASMVGAGLAGMAVTGVATFVGIILGTILILIGLILSLGGRREVVVVAR